MYSNDNDYNKKIGQIKKSKRIKMKEDRNPIIQKKKADD